MASGYGQSKRSTKLEPGDWYSGWRDYALVTPIELTESELGRLKRALEGKKVQYPAWEWRDYPVRDPRFAEDYDCDLPWLE